MIMNILDCIDGDPEYDCVKPSQICGADSICDCASGYLKLLGTENLVCQASKFK